MKILHQIDFYKADHRSQYPKGTTLVFSNLTARSSRIEGINSTVFYGLSYFINKFLIEAFDEFFAAPKEAVVADYKARLESSGIFISGYDHIEALHDLQYLPIEIWAVPEGTEVPIGVPSMVMWNTHPEFFWLTNYLETLLSASIWGMITSATIAKQYRSIFMNAMERTAGPVEFVDWQGHDFSMRGMYGVEASAMSGSGHLLSFNGTDTIPAIDFHEKYYYGDYTLAEGGIIGGSVAATEHSVMCMGGENDELETYRRLITEVYPSGIVSIVSDTWDYWGVWTDIIPALKNEILARDGKLVIRPDSGDPVKIICGDPDAPEGSPEYKGSFQVAWEIFGGTYTTNGFRMLDEHIGLIYGDSITLGRAEEICERLMAKGFVPSMVFGIGSYTYQCVTRDTFGFAVKATYGEVNGVGREIFKDPKTDNGVKKSARGLLAVRYGRDMGRFDSMDKLFLDQQVEWDDVKNCVFVERFKDGHEYNDSSLDEIRALVRG